MVQKIKLIELTIAVLASLGLFLGSVPFLMFALALLGLQAAFFGPVKYGIIPQLLDPDELVEGNALVETGTKLAILGGTDVLPITPFGDGWRSAGRHEVGDSGLFRSVDRGIGGGLPAG